MKHNSMLKTLKDDTTCDETEDSTIRLNNTSKGPDIGPRRLIDDEYHILKCHDLEAERLPYLSRDN